MSNKVQNEDRRAGREGILFVISAPSGAGKTSICREIVDIFPELRQSVSYTTRPRRNGERDGVDYHFVTAGQFGQMVAAKAFAEWAEVHGNCYGTALTTLEAARRDSVDILLDIDCQGAAQLKDSCPSALFIFVLPPSLAVLQARLQGRQTDAPADVARRLENARGEIAQASWYDYLVINDRLEDAVTEVASIVRAERCRMWRRQALLVKEFNLVRTIRPDGRKEL
jgi:guanylate kinase